MFNAVSKWAFFSKCGKDKFYLCQYTMQWCQLIHNCKMLIEIIFKRLLGFMNTFFSNYEIIYGNNEQLVIIITKKPFDDHEKKLVITKKLLVIMKKLL